MTICIGVEEVSTLCSQLGISTWTAIEAGLLIGFLPGYFMCPHIKSWIKKNKKNKSAEICPLSRK